MPFTVTGPVCDICGTPTPSCDLTPILVPNGNIWHICPSCTTELPQPPCSATIVGPHLSPIPCPDCGGDGGFEDERGCEVCTACNGAGEVDVCPACMQEPVITGGSEVCGCGSVAVELGQVA